ncbi:hypothetical protein J6590_047779 [Homalodisca vitripennis]|nr:hypothetical protein J6590_047779 [Homalodisca vitripennis]
MPSLIRFTTLTSPLLTLSSSRSLRLIINQILKSPIETTSVTVSQQVAISRYAVALDISTALAKALSPPHIQPYKRKESNEFILTGDGKTTIGVDKQRPCRKKVGLLLSSPWLLRGHLQSSVQIIEEPISSQEWDVGTEISPGDKDLLRDSCDLFHS